VRLTLWLGAHRSWPELRLLAAGAEQAGWDGVRFGDGGDREGHGRECWAVLGALAEAVPRVRLEAVVHDDRGRHPAVVAKLASTVDQLSGGRLLLGWAPAAGTDGEARLAEGVEIVKSLASRDRSSWGGRFYRLQDAPLDPKPRQQPFPVMLVGTSAELAARCADHWSFTASDLGSRLVALDEACRRLGRHRGDVRVSAWGEAPVPDGIDEWVVLDRTLGDDVATWSVSLDRIRASIGP
jgi:alkanesulfonate monooxygenase SsuD/methylene tetrahydromethanopterin reductase-like flavin-dependent oxidoreductase (luciferase family)